MTERFVPRTGADVLAHFRGFGLPPGAMDYCEYHAERYAHLIQLVASLPAPREVLDVGTFLQTDLLRRAFPHAPVHTLGEPGGFEGSWGSTRPGETHTAFDLNDAQFPDRVPALREHDLVVMAEVIEHLYTAPTLVLRAMRRWVRPGGRLVLQTPNAARLLARAKLLAGRNPYEMIRESRRHPGHFREYTLGELTAVAAAAGWTVERADLRSYFQGTSALERLVARCGPLLPPSLRDGITMVLWHPHRQ